MHFAAGHPGDSPLFRVKNEKMGPHFGTSQLFIIFADKKKMLSWKYTPN